MNQLKSLFKLIIILGLSLPILSQKENSFIQWSESQGKMTLSAAKEKCKSIDMRLPTRDEFKLAYSNGVTKSWKKDGEIYWTQDGYSDEYSYSFDITNGTYGYYEGKLERIVRCVSSSATSTPVKEVKNTSGPKWSDYLGLLNWESAKKKCESLGLRLPTRDEMIAAFQAGETKSWEKDGEAFWTSTEFSNSGNHYYFGIVSGFSSHYGDNTDEGHVRCIR